MSDDEHLLDLAVDLLEPEPLDERERAASLPSTCPEAVVKPSPVRWEASSWSSAVPTPARRAPG